RSRRCPRASAPGPHAWLTCFRRTWSRPCSASLLRWKVLVAAVARIRPYARPWRPPCPRQQWGIWLRSIQAMTVTVEIVTTTTPTLPPLLLLLLPLLFPPEPKRTRQERQRRWSCAAVLLSKCRL